MSLNGNVSRVSTLQPLFWVRSAMGIPISLYQHRDLLSYTWNSMNLFCLYFYKEINEDFNRMITQTKVLEFYNGNMLRQKEWQIVDTFQRLLHILLFTLKL